METALALGVIAFALTALVALLPGGLTHFRQAMDASIGAQIYQRVVTDLEQADFETPLDSTSTAEFHALPTRFFDDQGDEVAATDAARIVYQVRVRIAAPGPARVGTSAPGFTSLPAAPGETRFAPRDAVFVTIQVAHHPREQELPIGPQSLWVQPAAQESASMLTYSAIITRNGHKPPAAK